MYSIEDWQKMQQIDIKSVNPEEVVDISQIEIDRRQPVARRVKNYVETVQNPFLVKVGDYIVKLGYSDGRETLNDRMKQYILKMAKEKF